MVHHINRFDNGFLDDEISRVFAMYNKHNMGNPDLFTNVFEAISFDDIIKEGKILEEKNVAYVKKIIKTGVKYCLEVRNTPTNIFEVVIDDEFLPMGIADEFYKDKSNKNYVVVTIFYPKTGGTKFSFRSIENDVGTNAVDLATSIGGGGHKHSSACFHKEGVLKSFADKLLNRY